MSGIAGDEFGPETLAAEYVLGTLDAAEAETARARQEVDRLFAAEIRFWENRLFPLTTLVPPVPPPATLWTRIEDTTGGAASPAVPGRASPQPANDNAMRRWRATALTALVSLAVAASAAAFLAIRAVPPGGREAGAVFAVLSPTGSTAPVLVALAGPDGGIVVRPSGALTVASGRDLQLWALAAGATRPASLGVLPAGGTRVPPGIVPGTQLLVSLEPKGGSPTGQPTGPVVYGGTLQRAE